jgi:hypothetical protein
MSDLDRLLDEFIAAFEADRDLDLDELLARAPAGERQELGERIDAYLMRAPRRQWDAAAYAESPAKRAVERVWESLEGVSGTWPKLLPALRKAARIKRQDLVRRLSEALGVSTQQEKVAAYYNDMEHGRLPAAGVSARVTDALAAILGADPDEIRRAGRATAAVEPTDDALFARAAAPDEEYADAEGLISASDSERVGKADRDEVDELFTGG